MKRAGILAAALAMTVSLTACGNRNNSMTGSRDGYGTDNGYNSAYNADNYNSGYDNPVTDSGSMAGDNLYGNGTYGNTYGNSATGTYGSTVTGSENRSTNSTSFQQMLENARVHDTDGVLTDGENARTR